MIPFAVADVKNNIPGSPFFEKYTRNNNIQDFNMHFKHLFVDQLSIASLITVIEKSEQSQPILKPKLYKHYTFQSKNQNL